MTDLLQILSTLLQFFAFVLVATAVVCIPLVALFWSAEFAQHIRPGRKHSRRQVIPLSKIA